MIYDNYIFDLYGTLIDIHTDEEAKEFWEKVAGYIKKEFGLEFKPDELHRRYREVYDEEVEKLAKELTACKRNNVDKSNDVSTVKSRKGILPVLDNTIRGNMHPEIRVSWVWDRILGEGAVHASAAQIPSPIPNDGPVDTPSPEIQRLCTFFRESSRDRMKIYPGTKETLQKIKDGGKRVFLLSNAQRSFTYKEIQECGLEPYFDGIFISSDKMIMKPQKEFLEALMEKYSLDRSKCVMIGNEIGSDIAIADNCGIDSILIKDGDFRKIL